MEALEKSRQQILDTKGGDLLAQATAVRIMAAHARARPSVVFPGLYGVIHTPDEIVGPVRGIHGASVGYAAYVKPGGISRARHRARGVSAPARAPA